MPSKKVTQTKVRLVKITRPSLAVDFTAGAGFSNRYNLRLGGSINFKTRANFSEKNRLSYVEKQKIGHMNNKPKSQYLKSNFFSPTLKVQKNKVTFFFILGLF